MLNNLIVTSNWRILPELADFIIKLDPKMIKISANYSESIPDVLRLFLCKTWPEIMVGIISLLHMTFKVCKIQVHDNESLDTTVKSVLEKISSWINDAVAELKIIEIKEEYQKYIFNNTISSICMLFKQLFKAKIHKFLDYEWIKCALELSFISRAKNGSNEAISSVNSMLSSFLVDCDIMQLIERLRSETLKYWHLGPDLSQIVQTNEEWKIRENCIIIYEACSAYNIDYMHEDALNFDEIKTFFTDDNVYVSKQARN